MTNSTTYGYHTGDGTVSDSAGIIAKVHLNGDGTGYYTLAKENYATQYTLQKVTNVGQEVNFK